MHLWRTFIEIKRLDIVQHSLKCNSVRDSAWNTSQGTLKALFHTNSWRNLLGVEKHSQLNGSLLSNWRHRAYSLTLVPLVHPPTFHLFFPFFSRPVLSVYLRRLLRASTHCSPPDPAIVINFVLWQIILWGSHTVCIPFCSVFYQFTLHLLYKKKKIKEIFGLCVVQWWASVVEPSSRTW